MRATRTLRASAKAGGFRPRTTTVDNLRATEGAQGCPDRARSRPPNTLHGMALHAVCIALQSVDESNKFENTTWSCWTAKKNWHGMRPAASNESSIRQLILDATACDGAAPGGRTSGQGRGRRQGFGNHQLPTTHQLRAVKAIGKHSKDSIRELYDVIMERLAYPSSHVRVCALEIYEALFDRSSAFRRLGCDRLDTMVARTILGKLPSPVSYANELQYRALGLVRRWNREFGSVQPKLGLACRYLDSLGMFTDIHSRDDGRTGGSDDDEGGGDEGSGRNGGETATLSPAVERAVEEFRSGVAQWRILVMELENARVVLESSKTSRKSVFLTKSIDTGGGEDDDEAWEEVDEEGDLTDDVYVPLLESYREASSETIPKLQRIMGACREMYSTGFDPRVSEVLQQAVELNAALVSACSEYERKLGDTVRLAQGKKKGTCGTPNAGSGGDGARRGKEGPESRGRPRERSDDVAPPPINPMQLIRDPTMPRERPVERKKRHVKLETETGEGRDLEKRSVLQKLAAVAPIVPTSGFASVWDSHAPTTAVLGQTMEVSNHWGPVDVTKELPKDRLDALFLIDQTKVKFKDDQGGGSEAAATPPQQTRRTHQMLNQRANGGADIASARLTDRNEERRFNEEVLRQASAATEFGFISRPDDGRGGNANPKPKLRIKESLKKKLRLK